MPLPHPSITPIPNNEPEAVPSLWNTRYAEIDENFTDLDARATALASEIAAARAGNPQLADTINAIISQIGGISGTLSGLASPVSVQRAVSLDWLYRDRRIVFELFAAGYRLEAHPGVSVISGIMGDDTLDVASTDGIAAGRDYLLSEGANTALVRVAQVLTPQRLRLTSNLSRTWSSAAKLTGMTFKPRSEGGVNAPVGSQWVSTLINLGNNTQSRAVVIRRTHNSANVRLFFRDDYTTVWTERPWSVKRVGGGTSGIPGGMADYEYVIPMRGDGFLRIEVEGEPTVIAHIVGLGGVTGLGGAINPAMAPSAPVIDYPANGATNIGEMPTIQIGGYKSPAGNAFASATIQVSTSASFATILHEAAASAMSYTLPAGLLSTSTTYHVRARVTDVAGLKSNWSAVSSFTTKSSFAYVATPAITSPAAGATDIPEQPTLISTAFAVTGGADTHAASQWQIRLQSGSWANPLHDSGESTSAKTSYVVPAGILQPGQTQYVVRMRHKGASLGWSEWSADVSFTTKQVFAQIIGLVQKATGGGAGTYTRIDKDFAEIANPGAAYWNNHPTYSGIVDQTIDGQSMVKIPRFYFKAGTVPSGYPNAGKAYWMISDQPVSGFSVHPAFIGPGGQVFDQIWVGKYQASASGGKLQSVPGVTPRVSMNFPTARSEAYARNTGGVSGFRLWSIYDLAAIQMLATIEMGGLDMQSLIGQGRVNASGATAVDASDVAQATWRGIVGLWGNVWQMTDGIKRNGGQWYRWQYNVPGNTTANDFSTGYVSAGSDLQSSGYPVTFNASLLSAGLIIPATVDGSSSNGSTGDYFWSNANTDDRIWYNGGDWDDGAVAGLFYGDASLAPSNAGSTIGARLAKV